MSGVAGLDVERLRAFLDRVCPGLVGAPLRAELIQGGRSNLTYAVSDGHASWVVRRPPLGHVLTTAHDMTREFRVLAALGPTSVPVPRTVALCTDVEVIGVPFYVMEKVEGQVLRTAAQAAGLGRRRLADLADSLVDVLVELHAVDPADVGLADFGKPEGYLERQLSRWARQLDASRSRDLPGLDELRAMLAADIPPATGRTGIVHGDYRLDNVIVDADDRIAAVLDWEMATLGDQRSDLGLLLMYWEIMLEGPFIGGAPAERPDTGLFPSGRRLAERYAQRSGADLARLSWYAAFAYFKLAVIAEGIHYRYAAGQTLGEGFDKFGAMVPLLVERGHGKLAEA